MIHLSPHGALTALAALCLIALYMLAHTLRRVTRARRELRRRGAPC
jgi:hypothetical protein